MALTTAALLGCGGDSRTIAEQWNEICRGGTRERLRNELVTAADFRRLVDSGRETRQRLRDVVPRSELDATQRDALGAFAYQRALERRFLAETQRRHVAEVALEFAKPADAVARRVRQTFTAAGAPHCADYPFLR